MSIETLIGIPVLLFSEYQETMIVWDSAYVVLIGEGLYQEGSESSMFQLIF